MHTRTRAATVSPQSACAPSRWPRGDTKPTHRPRAAPLRRSALGLSSAVLSPHSTGMDGGAPLPEERGCSGPTPPPTRQGDRVSEFPSAVKPHLRSSGTYLFTCCPTSWTARFVLIFPGTNAFFTQDLDVLRTPPTMCLLLPKRSSPILNRPFFSFASFFPHRGGQNSGRRGRAGWSKAGR